MMVHKDSFLQSYENLLRKKESRLTRISICIVWLFILCHVWKLIPTVYELLYSEVKIWYVIIKVIESLGMNLIVSAINFLSIEIAKKNFFLVNFTFMAKWLVNKNNNKILDMASLKFIKPSYSLTSVVCFDFDNWSS